MAGGNPPKPPPSSSSSSASHRKSRWQSSAATPTTNPADKKPSAAPSTAADSKQKLSSNSTTNKPPTPKPKPKPDNSKTTNPSPKPSSRPSPKPTSGPSPKPDPIHSNLPPFPFQDPPPPPSYGFHMLDRRTIVLADGSVRSYFALPPDYREFTPLPRPDFVGPPPGLPFDRQFPMSPDFRPDMRPEIHGRDDLHLRNRNQDYWNSLGLDGPRGGVGPGPGLENSLKRKYVEEEREREMRDGFERQRQQLLQYGNPNGGLLPMPQGPGPSGVNRGGDMRTTKYMRIGEGNVGRTKHNEVDQGMLKKSFLNFVKLIYENANQKRRYLEGGKQGPLHCLACPRSSKDFPDMHALIIHTYNPESADLLVDHLGFHKALCILKGWNYLMPPDNSKAYQILSADEATANQDDLIMWPPLVIIHNTITGRGREGRMEGLGNRAMDGYLRDLGFVGGKSKSLYSRDGHLGITLVKFASDESGLKDAIRLGDYFEKDNRGRIGWSRVQSLTSGKDDENNPHLVKVDQRTGEKKRTFYGYLATVSDMDKVDFETRKKIMVESRREYKPSL